MKQIFRCEYCSFTGTAEEIMAHEQRCSDNYNKKSCYTCKHKEYKSIGQYKCSCGIDIPENKIWQYCPSYERKVKSANPMLDFFGGFPFGKATDV